MLRSRALRSIALSWLLLAALHAAAAQGDDRVRVALLPLVVRSTESREFLQRGLTDMLVSRIGRERRIAILPLVDAKLATTETAAAREVGVANDAAFVLFGSFTHLADGASLDVACAPVDGEAEPRRIYVHAANMAEMIPLLDGVADRIAAMVLGESGAAGTASPSPPPAAAPQDREGSRVR